MSRWRAPNQSIFELPSDPEFKELSLVVELVAFSNASPEEYVAPVNYGQAFSLTCPADLQGVDGYLTLMADKFDVPVQQLTNNNSIRHVRSLMRDRYRESAHGARKMGLCGKCLQSLPAHPPERHHVTTTLYCRKDVVFFRFFLASQRMQLLVQT